LSATATGAARLILLRLIIIFKVLTDIAGTEAVTILCRRDRKAADKRKKNGKFFHCKV
jgi:hypothetical protein